MENINTHFFDINGDKIGSLFGLAPVSNGMKVEIKGTNYTVDYIKLVLADNSKNDPELGFHVYCK